MKISREKEAISAYLKFLQSKGASTNVLYKRSLFLDQLTPLLANKTLERLHYRLALDIAMAKMPLDTQQDSLNIAREFYAFWIKDIKAITAFGAHYGFDVQSIKWKPLATSLTQLIESLDKQTFNPNETVALGAYGKALMKVHLTTAQIDAQLTLAKIILLRLRDAPVLNHKCYRIAVDLTLPLLTMPESKDFFLKVVREFYPYWILEQHSA